MRFLLVITTINSIEVKQPMVKSFPIKNTIWNTRQTNLKTTKMLLSSSMTVDHLRKVLKLIYSKKASNQITHDPNAGKIKVTFEVINDSR